MALLDFLRQKEFAEISALKNKLALLEKDIEIFREREDRLNLDILSLRNERDKLLKYKDVSDVDNEKERIIKELKDAKEELQKEELESKDNIEKLKKEAEELLEEIENKKKQVVELDNTILLQDYGMYSPVYDFADSEMYKDRLDAIRTEQKNMILYKTAATCSTNWTLNGSEAQGRVMTNQNIKQILRCFNDECDMLISKVKFNNATAFIEKIRRSYDALNKMNSKNAVSISYEYLELKVQELQLAYEYARKKQEEKEEQRRIREQMREEARLQKEIEEARKDIEKEQKHYMNALLKLDKQLGECDEVEKEVLLEKKSEIERHLSDLDIAIKDIDYREANKRAGYVYIISNIGSFGENVYKIGMTRRLDPMERVDELGDASVPFKFDVHAMIFSDDAPTLETALHHAFENKKVNMINGRREFFNVTLEEIEEVVKANYDKTVEFVKIPQAEQYRESQKILKSLEIS
ncbi:DUF4041 domain-containing protein (plasmid) [Bacteroides thetaiotaomicron]|uniref:DUF4041 domain-containing protein n=2 Tax=Bacteroides TaxID=816 RepID=UPI0021643610|nr:DUF4041 domain-containing protein [Bacteroides thetaiotaomicron]UVS55791.1 DUF4041 domain-containing protein [Bacteroides thetaiotaomicron]